MKVLILLALVAAACAQPFQPGFGVAPLGNLLTTDRDGPYNLTLLSQQANEIKAGIAARGNFTDKDLVDFLVNVECLEGQFDTYGAFGVGFNGNLALGGPAPIGAGKANLTEMTLPYMQEVALNEQGHALFTRHAGGANPCPVTDVTGGFNSLMAYAYGLQGNQTVASVFGSAFNPLLNDQNFVLSVLTLEELGATGNKGLALLASNPVIADGIASLGTSATAQATVQRVLLYQMRNLIVAPFNETVQQVFARVSAARDSLDGPLTDDQGLLNTDPRFIAVPDTFINNIPTDIQGCTLARTPQQIIRIVTGASANSKGWFFPNGLLGNINSSVGYNVTASGTAAFPTSASALATAAPLAAIGTIMPPINSSAPTLPATVPDETLLTQSLSGPLDNGTYLTRGYSTMGSGTVNRMAANGVGIGGAVSGATGGMNATMFTAAAGR